MTLAEQFKSACYSGYENDSQSDHFISGARYEYARLLPFLNVAADVIGSAEGIDAAFKYISEKQDHLLTHGFEEACANWEEATSEMIDFEPLKSALNRLREVLCKE